ncbi:unnamed protein product [Owenia fusiformis]|uniref:Uncharacterized protein n=1 Tax=Owenia fusiformis TaxID=6347 RepID=A0A8J1XYQ7_OWEFU|nr:unnamed protein product [Owenia fusiformis]
MRELSIIEYCWSDDDVKNLLDIILEHKGVETVFDLPAEDVADLGLWTESEAVKTQESMISDSTDADVLHEYVRLVEQHERCDEHPLLNDCGVTLTITPPDETDTDQIETEETTTNETATEKTETDETTTEETATDETDTDKTGTDETKTDETDETKTGGTETDETATGETATDEIETGSTASGETQTDETETDETGSGETQTNETTSGDTPTDETITNETASGETHTDDTQIDETTSSVTQTDETTSSVTETDETETEVIQTDKTETDKTQTDKTETDKTQTDETKTDKTTSGETKTQETSTRKTPSEGTGEIGTKEPAKVECPKPDAFSVENLRDISCDEIASISPLINSCVDLNFMRAECITTNLLAILAESDLNENHKVAMKGKLKAKIEQLQASEEPTDDNFHFVKAAFAYLDDVELNDVFLRGVLAFVTEDHDYWAEKLQFKIAAYLKSSSCENAEEMRGCVKELRRFMCHISTTTAEKVDNLLTWDEETLKEITDPCFPSLLENRIAQVKLELIGGVENLKADDMTDETLVKGVLRVSTFESLANVDVSVATALLVTLKPKKIAAADNSELTGSTSIAYVEEPKRASPEELALTQVLIESTGGIENCNEEVLDMLFQTNLSPDEIDKAPADIKCNMEKPYTSMDKKTIPTFVRSCMRVWQKFAFATMEKYGRGVVGVTREDFGNIPNDKNIWDVMGFVKQYGNELDDIQRSGVKEAIQPRLDTGISKIEEIESVIWLKTLFGSDELKQFSPEVQKHVLKSAFPTNHCFTPRDKARQLLAMSIQLGISVCEMDTQALSVMTSDDLAMLIKRDTDDLKRCIFQIDKHSQIQNIQSDICGFVKENFGLAYIQYFEPK